MSFGDKEKRNKCTERTKRINMAVKLKELYREITNKHKVSLLTEDLFDKSIEWIHIADKVEFLDLLHGDELIFNSSLNGATQEQWREFLDKLLEVRASGLVIALQDTYEVPKEIIQYCNEQRFPIIGTDWNTPFMDIMRRFSEILLAQERMDVNLGEALKNAIYYPENEKSYRQHFGKYNILQKEEYVIAIVESAEIEKEKKNWKTKMLLKSLRQQQDEHIIYEEDGRIVCLFAFNVPGMIKDAVTYLATREEAYVGIGTVEYDVKDIYKSYKKAQIAFELAKKPSWNNIVDYDELGVYQVLADMKHTNIQDMFVENVLGKLIRWDEKNQTDYMAVLEQYYECECNVVKTAEKIGYHKNTIKYKLQHIREILGFDIASNESRMNIMLALKIMQMN